MLNTEFPVVSGHYQMTREWSIALPGQFNRRIEDEDLVIWRPGFTMWIAVWGNNHKQTKAARLDEVKRVVSPDAFDLEEAEDSGVLRFAYRLQEEAADERVAAFYGCVIGETGQVDMAIYFDQEADAATARKIMKSILEGAPGLS